MKRLNVLLLGWDFLAAAPKALGKSCYNIAKELADKVNLAVLLPQVKPEFAIPQVEITGLDQLDLEAIPANRPQPKVLPYADEPYIRRHVPLYGSAGMVTHAPVHPGQEQSSGTFATKESAHDKYVRNQRIGTDSPNIFRYQDFEALGLDAQVIQYARYTSRWAAHRNFDVIYAYNYRTFLAGMELKMVSGKKLLLHVDSLSYERQHPNSKGWMFALEQLALTKGDYVFTNTDSLATILEEKYNLSPEVIQPLEKAEGVPSTRIRAGAEKAFVNLSISHYAEEEPETEEEIREQTGDLVWQVLQRLAAA